jgi:hypothetical protein
MLCVACGSPTRPSLASTPPGPTPPLLTSGNCFGELGDVNGPAAQFPEALVRDGVRCQGPLAYAEERHCVGVYVAVRQGDLLLGGTTRYYDGDRRLIAVFSQTDHGAYCNRTSMDILYGTIPRCPGPLIVTNLCRR